MPVIEPPIDRHSPIGLYELVEGFGRNLTRTCDVLGPLVAQLQDLAEATNEEIAAIIAAISSLSGGSLPTNMEIPIINSGAYAATQTSADLTNDSFSRLSLVVHIQGSVGAFSLTPSLQIKDSISGAYKTVWTAARAITTVDTFVYYFADGANSGAFTETRGFGLPAKTWRIVMTAGNGNEVDYSVSGVLMT